MAQHPLVPYSESGRPLYLLPRSRAGDAPTILAAHGLRRRRACSNRCSRRLGGQFHMVAPDYPGFGHSDAPTPKAFSYTFDNIAKVMDHFTEALNLSKYTLYMQTTADRSAFGWRAHQERVEALIVKMPSPTTKASARLEDKACVLADLASHEAALRTNLLLLDTTRTRHVGYDPNPRSTIPISGPTNARS